MREASEHIESKLRTSNQLRFFLIVIRSNFSRVFGALLDVDLDLLLPLSSLPLSYLSICLLISLTLLTIKSFYNDERERERER
jgi:hypothetical protein